MDICACGTTLSQAVDYACLFFKWHVAVQMTCATPAKCQRRIHNMHNLNHAPMVLRVQTRL